MQFSQVCFHIRKYWPFENIFIESQHQEEGYLRGQQICHMQNTPLAMPPSIQSVDWLAPAALHVGPHSIPSPSAMYHALQSFCCFQYDTGLAAKVELILFNQLGHMVEFCQTDQLLKKMSLSKLHHKPAFCLHQWWLLRQL